MKKLIEWMNNSFAPKMNKIVRNPYIASIQDTMIAIMPIILVSSFVSIISALGENWTWIPDCSYITSFSIGIISLFVAYLMPMSILEKKRKNKYKKQAGCLGIAFFIMMSVPSFNEDGMLLLDTSRIGSGGIFIAIFAGIIVAFILLMSDKITLFKNNPTMPKFLADSFDSIIPILGVMLVGFVFCNLLGLDLYGLISMLLQPIMDSALSFGGLVVISFLGCFLYTFGISTWLIYGLYYPIYLNAVMLNAEKVAAGEAATYIATNETMYLTMFGGFGSTLMLCVMFAFLAKSKKLKGLGRTALLPSLLNINEPIVFGSVAFNPILMIPMWISGIIIPIIVWLSMSSGLVAIPSSVFTFWYAPFIMSYLVNYDWKIYILVTVVLAVSALIYYPFFKVYDNQCVKEEEEEKAAES